MALTPGTVTIVAVTRTTVTMSASPATGGLGTVTYQWYRSTQYGFTPTAATLLAGEDSLTLNDSNLDENAIYYYVLQATDSTPVTASYPQTGALTNGPSVSGYVYPQVPQFQDFFIDDFPYGPDPRSQFPDYRILRAMQMANTAFFNPIFFSTQSEFSNGFLLLSAHYMVMNIRRASQGMKGQFGFLQSSKSAGISVGIEIPERIKANPDFAWLCQTNYGAEYLHMIIPQLTAQMWASPTVTNP